MIDGHASKVQLQIHVPVSLYRKAVYFIIITTVGLIRSYNRSIYSLYREMRYFTSESTNMHLLAIGAAQTRSGAYSAPQTSIAGLGGTGKGNKGVEERG